MGADNDAARDFNAVIREQRNQKPGPREILKTISSLPVDYLVEYLAFLEHRYSIKPGRESTRLIFSKLEIDNKKYIATHAEGVNSKSLERLSRLVFSKSDRLLDNFLETPFPDKMINDYVLLRANQINRKLKGHFSNALELIKLGIELNKGRNPEELFSTFKTMKNHYLETKFPPVDINTFFKLVIPILKRCSIRRGPAGFYDLRDRIIQELRNDGLTPDQLSIDILDRRGKHRATPIKLDEYRNYRHD
ncbi:MAG: hypothetical protein MJE63_05120 [Proteobacteria bacterium]|nr:hypothetical protein [Pseudomonadota bacterium]